MVMVVWGLTLFGRGAHQDFPGFPWGTTTWVTMKLRLSETGSLGATGSASYGSVFFLGDAQNDGFERDHSRYCWTILNPLAVVWFHASLTGSGLVPSRVLGQPSNLTFSSLAWLN